MTGSMISLDNITPAAQGGCRLSQQTPVPRFTADLIKGSFCFANALDDVDEERAVGEAVAAAAADAGAADVRLDSASGGQQQPPFASAFPAAMSSAVSASVTVCGDADCVAVHSRSANRHSLLDRLCTRL